MSNSILFVDSNVTDYQTLLIGLGNAIEVHIVTAEENGVLQIANILKDRTDLDAIHIISHGSRGALPLGSSVLNNDNVSSYKAALKQIGSALSKDGDILLYGCNVAQGDVGQHFINQLSQYTGADVAASTDLTGNAALGGDWVLETNTGVIEADIILQKSGLDAYDGILPNTAPTFTGGANTGLTVLEDANATVIDNSVLQVTDGEQVPTQLTYTLTALPANGVLSKSNSSLAVNSTFTQADIDNGYLKFTPTFNANGSDSFGFSVSDGQGGTLSNQTFNFTITPVVDVNIAASTTPVEGSTVGTYTITLDSSPVSPLVVNYTLAGTATLNTDYTVTAGTNASTVTGSSFTVAAGQTSATLNINALTDAVSDPNETVILKLAAGAGYQLAATSSSSFMPKVDYTAGTNPQSVSVGDFNNDGKLDLAVVDYDINKVSVLLRNSTNTGFDTKLDYETDLYPSSVSVGDFNNDGKLDLAVACQVGSVSVLLRNSANTGFDTKLDYAAGLYPQSVSVGDFNNDGKLDLAVADYSGHAVSVLLRNSTNTGFDTKLDYDTGVSPQSVSVGDFNNDGKLDLAVANQGGGNVSVLLRDSTNTGFDTKADYTTGSEPSSVSVGDFNNDGKLDLAVANKHDFSVSVLLRNSVNTGFDVKVDYDTVIFPSSVSVGDFNNDGKLDLAVSGLGNSLSILLRNSTNTDFDRKVDYFVGVGSSSVSVGDFDNDGKLDLAVANSVSVPVLTNNTAPNATLTITDVPPNTAPTVSANTGLTVLEDASATLIITTQLQVTDLEQAASALTYTVTTATTKGVLSKSGSALAVNGTFTQADIDNNSIQFRPSSNANGSDSFKFTVSDGVGGNIAETTFNLTITSVNDAPSFTGNATLAAVNEDTLSPRGNNIFSMLGSKFSDTADSNTFTGIAVSSDAANPSTEGKWQYGFDGGATWLDVSDTAVSTTAALLLHTGMDLRFLPVANYNGTPGNLTVYAVENSSGTGFTSNSFRQTFDTTADNLTSNVSAAGVSFSTSITSVNDTPVLAKNNTLTLSEDASATVIGNSILQVTDVDNSTAQLTYTLTALPANGVLKKGVTTLNLTTNKTFTQADIDSGSLKFALNANANGSDSFKFTVSDGAGGNIAEKTFNLNITPVVDAFTSTGTTAFVEAKDIPSTAVAIDSALLIDNSNLTAGSNAPIVVDQANDNGKGDMSGSLSWAIQQANTTAGLDTIQLRTNVMLSFGSGIILANSAINSDVIIDGQAHFVSGNNARSLFYVYGGNDPGISIPTSTDKGANNEVDVTFTNLTLKDGYARGGDGHYGGAGAGMGGALFVYQGNINIDNVTFSHNQAIGGSHANTGTPVIGTSGGGGNGLSGTNGSYGGSGGYGDGGFGSGSGDGSGFGGGFGGGSSGFGGGAGDYYGGGFGGGGISPTNYGGGAGFGGAVFIRTGTANLNNVTFTNNVATGGLGVNSFATTDDGKGYGGAIFVVHSTTNTNSNNEGMPSVLPTVNLNNVNFNGNSAGDSTDVYSGVTNNTNVFGKTSNLITPTLASATVTISNYQSGEDVLQFTNDTVNMGNIAVNSNTNGILTLRSAGNTATYNQWQAALRAVQYLNNSDTPNTADRKIEFVVNDGTQDSTVATKIVSVAATNDTPVIATISTLTLSEDASPTTITTTNLQVTDVDNTNAQLTYTLTALPANGVLKNSSTTLDLSSHKTFTQADIDSGSLKFALNANANGSDSFKFTISDGAGGNIAQQTFNLNITVNIAPKSLAYGATTFVEAAANNGSVTTSSTITLTNDSFTGTNGAALGAVSNVPAGLTASLVKASATTATLSFTGNAAAHANANDINNLTVTFANADFAGGSAAGVTGATKNDLNVDFADPLSTPAPVNHLPTGAVTIGGTTEVGQVLTAANTLADADGLGTISYQWQAGNTAISTNSATYMLTASELGQTITVAASYTDGLGNAESVGSLATAAVTAVMIPPVVTPPVVIIPVDIPPEVIPTPVVVAPPAPAPVSDPTPDPVITPPAPVVSPPPAPLTSTVVVMVDGVWVNKTTSTLNGLQVEHLNILPVSATRVEDTRTAHATLADIPVGSVGASAGLNVGLPVGVGLQTDGAVTPVTLANMNGFISDIQTVFGSTAANAVADGRSFLANFTASQTFFAQKVVFSSNSSTNGEAIIIDGSHTVSAGVTNPVNALVIDGSTLPTGATLELIQTAFAAIKGDVTVKADSTPNTLYVGSSQSEQKIFAYGGNDIVQVDSGSHLIHGGSGTDTVRLLGKSSDYQISQNFAVMTLTSKTNPNAVKTLVNVEKIAFEDQTIPVDYEVTPQIKAIAGTYKQMFGRQADLSGEQYWADAIANKGLTLGRMALFFMYSEEQLQKIGFDISKADIPTQVEQFYQSLLGRAADAVGKAFWVDKLTTGELTLESLATTVIESVEMQSHYIAPTQWDFSL